MNYKKLAGMMLFIGAISLTGCNSTTTQEPPGSMTQNVTVETATLDVNDQFTDRDKDSSYSEADATKIQLDQLDENTVTISEEGTYLVSGSLDDGQIVIDVDKKEKVQLVLQDVTLNCKTSAAIYVKQADKVFITLEGENKLSNSEDFVAIDDNNIDGVIFSKDDLTFNGSGSLTVVAKYGHGIVSKNDLVFTSGTYTVEAARHALSGKDSIRIAGGTYKLTAGKDAIHSKNTEDTTKGYVYIENGTFTISADDDGIHANSNVFISDGTVLITKSYEGIEGQQIVISGGTIEVKSSDDGLNATTAKTESSTEDGSTQEENSQSNSKRNPMEADGNCLITISGGEITIDADGDGIDSNGNLEVTGGTIYVEGPSNGGNGALDYSGTAKITGGIVVAIGASGMAQNFGSDSTQCSMLVTFQNQTTGEVVLKDSEGNSLVSYTSEKTYNSVVISTPEIKTGSTYTVSAGEESQSVEMTDTIYGEGFSMGGHGGGNFNKGDSNKGDFNKEDFNKDNKGGRDDKQRPEGKKGESQSEPESLPQNMPESASITDGEAM